MIFLIVPLALAAGMGIGFGYGVRFARQDQSSVFDLVTSTVDKLTTSALFPGLKGVIEQPTVEDPMFDTSDVDSPHIPEFLREEEDSPWDYVEAADG